MIQFAIDHLEHDGSVIATMEPTELEYIFNVSEKGSITAAFALSDPNMIQDGFAPKRTDFILKLTNDKGLTYDEIQGGICGPVNLSGEEETVKYTGFDWLWYMDNPVPFSYQTDLEFNISTDSPPFLSWVLQSQEQLVNDLFEVINTKSDIQFDPVFIGSTGWAEVLNYLIMFQDETSILGHIQNISNLQSPFGFDFYCDWDKTVRMFSPRTSDPSDAMPIALLNSAEQIVDIPSWTNAGPLATETIGLGAGAGNLSLWSRSTYGPSTEVYREWTRFVRLGENYRMPEQVVSGAAAVGYLDRFPQKDLTITIRPDQFDPFDETSGFYNNVGKAVDIRWEGYQEYHIIDAVFWINKQRFYFDDDGNALCDLSLQQIYA